jgi:GTP-binding protein
MAKKNYPTVLLFGRTNVGKSTLFNCLTEKNQALVSTIGGTTRDSNLGTLEWQGKQIGIIDSGGLIEPLRTARAKKEEGIDAIVQKQALGYLARADFIFLVVDARDGILPADKELARFIQKTPGIRKKTFLVANKADNPRLRKETVDFLKLGLGKPIPVSATTGSGTGDLLDLLLEKIKQTQNASGASPEIQEDEAVLVSLIGKPNVGKSSLANKLLREDRIIVSPIPHTTREPQDVLIEYNNRLINLIDTAGISRQGHKQAKYGKPKNKLEKMSVNRTLASLRRSNIALLMLDISQPITHQDAKLMEEIIKARNSCLIVANKWDLVQERDTKYYTAYIRSKLPFAAWAPIVFISAATGEKVANIPETILRIAKARNQEINENYLSKVLAKMVKKQSPRRGKGIGRPYIQALKQAAANPPVFTIRIGNKDNLSDNYLRFMENYLRDELGFLGTPLVLRILRGKQIEEKKKKQ